MFVRTSSLNCFFFAFFVAILSFSQSKPPSGYKNDVKVYNEKVKSDLEHTIIVEIPNNGVLEVNNNQVHYWDEIIYYVLKEVKSWGVEEYYIPRFIIKASNEVSYRFVEKIKEELFRYQNHDKLAVYESTVDDGRRAVSFICETPREMVRIKPITPRDTISGIEVNSVFSNLSGGNNDVLTNLFRQREIVRLIFTKRMDAAKELLKGYKTNYIRVLKHNRFLLDDRVYVYSDFGKIMGSKAGEVYFLIYDDINYGEYIDFLETTRAFDGKAFRDVDGPNNFFIEIPHSMENEIQGIFFQTID